MDDRVGRKQNSNNKSWLELWNNCTEKVSKKHIIEIESETIQKAKKIASQYKKIAYGYSGGKDSTVLASLLSKTGIKDLKPFCVLHQCEYPKFQEWLFSNCPKGTTFLKLEKLGLEELNRKPEYLFPTGKKEKAYYIGQWREAQTTYVKENNIDLVFAGRRIIDGNMCGKKNPDGIYVSKNKVITSCNLIADWSHEEILAYIKYNGLKLPPIYDFPNGWVYGTHAWTKRDRVNNSIYETFDEIMNIDKSIVIEASKTLDIAKEYLKERNYAK